MATIGGGTIVSFNSSQSWGVNPGAADGLVVVDEGDSFVISVGDAILYSFDGAGAFSGIVSEAKEDVNFGEGRRYALQVVDNRIRLMWQQVFGAWNIEDTVFDRVHARPQAPSGSTSNNSNSGDGGDGAGIGDDPDDDVGQYDPVSAEPEPTPWVVRRRWKHMLPEHWASGVWTYTDQPFTVREVLNSAFNQAWGRWGFGRSFHSAQDAVVTGLDHRTGIKLGNLVSDLNNRVGVDVRIEGQRTLVWGRKGEGLIPVRAASADQWSDGLSISGSDTRIRVVGEPVRVQQLNIELEPDWKDEWEQYLDELAWLKAVASVFAMPTATKADWADVAAFARTVTVSEFADKDDNDFLKDGRMFGKASRLDIPAWTYIHELVFRSYRIPEDYKVYGIPLDSLELADSLLCATSMDAAGANTMQIYPEENPEFYPPVQASAIVMGQPLDLINGRDIAMFYRNAGRKLSTEWSEAPEFEVDSAGKSIRFKTPVFIDGADGKSLYLMPNRGEGGGTDLSGSGAADDYLDVAIPNPGFEITAAKVKASFVFLLGKFHRDYGSGPRHGASHYAGLDLHLLDMTGVPPVSSGGLGAVDNSSLSIPNTDGVTFREILYEDGASAFAKADAIGLPLAGLRQTVRSGGFNNTGVAGSVLSEAVERITVNVAFPSGLSERVDYARSGAMVPEFPERAFQRIQRVADVFPGQEELFKEARQLREISRLERTVPAQRSRSHVSFRDVFEKPVGGDVASTSRILSKTERTWKAGDIVWLDRDGMATDIGGVFGGVVVADATGKQVHVCNAGRVPVKVTGNIPVNGVAMGSPGKVVASCLGQCAIGRLTHGKAVVSEDGAETVYAYLDVSAPGPDCRFRMYFDFYEQKLFVGPGNAGVISEGSLVYPMTPLLDGEPLDKTPYWDVSSKELGEWLICCRIGMSYSGPLGCVMRMVRNARELLLDEDSIAWLVGTVNLAENDGKRVLAGFDQRWWSDITVEFDSVGGGGGGSGSSSSSWDSSYSPPDESSSSKDTAVVKASWTRGGFAKLSALESPDVRFVDWCGDFRLVGRVTRVPIDPCFIEVCVRGTLKVFGVACSSPFPVGVTVDHAAGEIVFTALPFLRPESVAVTLVGERKGHGGKRFLNATRADYEINERRLNIFKRKGRRRHA